MIPLDIAVVFFVTCLSLCFIPGPDTIFIIAQSSWQGWRAGVTVTLGVCTGLLVQVIAFAYGITAIIETSAIAFTILKGAGIAYLSFLAWQAFTSPPSIPHPQVMDQSYKLPFRSLYQKGLLINISTPLAPLFLLIFFPPFVKPEYGAVFNQLITLGILLILSVLIMFSLFSVLANFVGKRIFQSVQAQRYLQYGSGLVIAGFAAYLALLSNS
jgi:threonine/homoserine/homoserine lactone efflux protein